MDLKQILNCHLLCFFAVLQDYFRKTIGTILHYFVYIFAFKLVNWFSSVVFVATLQGKMMELRCVVAVIRHGDRTPKQKMKVEVKHPKWVAKWSIQLSIERNWFLFIPQIFWDFRKIWWLQAWPHKIETTQTTTGNFRHCSLLAVGNSNKIGRFWGRGETGKAGTIEKRFGNVKTRFIFDIFRFIDTNNLVVYLKVWPLFGHQPQSTNEISTKGETERIELRWW